MILLHTSPEPNKIVLISKRDKEEKSGEMVIFAGAIECTIQQVAMTTSKPIQACMPAPQIDRQYCTMSSSANKRQNVHPLKTMNIPLVRIVHVSTNCLERSLSYQQPYILNKDSHQSFPICPSPSPSPSPLPLE